MRTFTNQFIATKVERQTYTGAKSEYALVAENIFVYLRQTAVEASAMNGVQYGKAYDVLTETGIFLFQEGDRLTIKPSNAETPIDVFIVKGVARHERGGVVQYRKYAVEKVVPEIS
jgi:hypothetical protein